MPPTAPSILVLIAHPQMRHSRVNRALMQAARDAATHPGQPAKVTVRDLYAHYPDYALDVRAEQRLAQAADLIIWQHPVQWYSMPALMKLWVDEVLARGWAYGPGGAALRGKHLWPVLSTGGPGDAYTEGGYNRYPFDAFLPPYQQTAALCGLHFIKPLVLHGAHAATDADIAQHAQRYAQLLSSFPNWCDAGMNLPCPSLNVPAADRPS